VAAARVAARMNIKFNCRGDLPVRISNGRYSQRVGARVPRALTRNELAAGGLEICGKSAGDLPVAAIDPPCRARVHPPYYSSLK